LDGINNTKLNVGADAGKGGVGQGDKSYDYVNKEKRK
jgi:hypothetical protein